MGTTNDWLWRERLREGDRRREQSLPPPFELEKLWGRHLCWSCKTVLSSLRNSLRIRSFNDMSVTVSIVFRTQNLVDGVDLVRVTKCTFYYKDLLIICCPRKKHFRCCIHYTYMKTFSAAELAIYSEVITVLKLILVNPSTNAVSERTFSAMRRIKTCLKSTMGQSHLNVAMILHVHKEHTGELSLVNIVNSFVNSEHRMTLFGTFSEVDM